MEHALSNETFKVMKFMNFPDWLR